jgi:hypothetical protein
MGGTMSSITAHSNDCGHQYAHCILKLSSIVQLISDIAQTYYAKVKVL